MRALKDVTVEEIALGSEAFRDVMLILIDAVVAVKDQGQNGGKFASHLLRRIVHDGEERIKYDPGDEPAMEIVDNVQWKP